MEPTTTQQPPALCVRFVGASGNRKTLSLRTAALTIGYRTDANPDNVWLDLRAGVSFEVGNETYTPLTSLDVIGGMA